MPYRQIYADDLEEEKYRQISPQELAPEEGPSLKERVKAGLGESFETAKSLGTVYGPAEVGASLVSGIPGFITQGVSQGIEAVSPGLTKTIGLQGLNRIAQMVQYQPKTQAGQQLMGALEAPFTTARQKGEETAEWVREKTGSPLLATGAGTAVAGLPEILMLLGIGKRGMAKTPEPIPSMPKDILDIMPERAPGLPALPGAQPRLMLPGPEAVPQLPPGVAEQRALPPGQGFAMQEPAPILRPAPIPPGVRPKLYREIDRLELPPERPRQIQVQFVEEMLPQDVKITRVSPKSEEIMGMEAPMSWQQAPPPLPEPLTSGFKKGEVKVTKKTPQAPEVEEIRKKFLARGEPAVETPKGAELTFRQYTEKQGYKWPEMTSSHPDYPNLFADYQNLLKSQRGAFQIPVEEITKAMKRFREFWVPLSTLPNKEALLDARNFAKGGLSRVEHIVDKEIARLKDLSPQQAKDVFQAIDGQIPWSNLTPEMERLAYNITAQNNLLGKMAVKRGLLSEEQFMQHQGRYVKYMYLKHIFGEDATLVNPVTGKLDLSYQKARQNLTPEQKRALGWVEDITKVQPLSTAKMLGDVVKYDYLDTISSHSEWTWQPSIVNIAGWPKEYDLTRAQGQATRLTNLTGEQHSVMPVRPGVFKVFNTVTGVDVGHKITIGELSKEVDIYHKMIKEAPNSPEIRARLDAYEIALNDARQATQNVPSEFIQMPTAKKWGPLAGAYVRKEIARDLFSFYGKEQTNIGGLSKTLEHLASADTLLTGMFKTLKVPFNIPTVMKNLFSNPMQMYLRGTPLHSIVPNVVRGAEAMLKKEQVFVQADRMGLFKTNWSVEELGEVIKELRHLEGDTIGDVMGGFRKVAKYYGRIDDLFKMATVIEETRKGTPLNVAVREAQKWIMDYSLVDPIIKWSRRHAVPFITYQYKIAPLIAESVAKRPWRMGLMLAMPYAVAEVVKELYKDSMTDGDWKELEKQIPQQVRDRNSWAIFPYKMGGKWYWFDYSAFLPWGNFQAAATDVYHGEFLKAASQFGIGQTPLVTLARAFVVSPLSKDPPKDPYTERSIYSPLEDRTSVKAAKTMEWIYNQFAPSMLTRYGGAGYTFDIGNKDRYGRVVIPEQAVGRWFGLNLNEISARSTNVGKNAMLDDARKEFFKLMTDPKATPKEKVRYKQQFQNKINEILERGEYPSPYGPLP